MDSKKGVSFLSKQLKEKEWKYFQYKLGDNNIIKSMTRKYATGRPKKKKIDWDDFTREELIEIAKRYKEITKDKKKKEKKWKNLKNVHLPVLKLVFLLGISKSSFYKNKKLLTKVKEIQN